MEEADLLGDTLGVMDKGKMQAQGTSLELKKNHGSGYGLNIVKTTDDVPIDRITELVTSFVSTASVRTDIGTEVSYTLPIDETNNFPKLFIKMQQDAESLGIATFGLTQTSLEEVFLNLAKLHDEEEDETENGWGPESFRLNWRQPAGTCVLPHRSPHVLCC